MLEKLFMSDIFHHYGPTHLLVTDREREEVDAIISEVVRLAGGEINLYLLRRLESCNRDCNPFVVGMKSQKNWVLLDFMLTSGRLRLAMSFRHRDCDWWTASKLMRTLKKQLGQNGKKKNGK